MDYRKFLDKTETLVLPYFGGTSVITSDRRLRVQLTIEPGWWEFSIKGRIATPVRRSEDYDLSTLPKIRGHYFNTWLFISGNEIERMHFIPTGTCDVFSPCIARRWYNGDLIFESADFEDEAEINARLALESNAAIADLKGIPASLRAAYGFALLRKEAQQRSMRVSPREVMRELGRVAVGGSEVAIDVLVNIAEQRQMQINRQRGMQRRDVVQESASNVRRHRRDSLEDDLLRVLANASADFRSFRLLEDNLVEVTFNFLGDRFITLVEADTFRVFDAGICLDGADRELTLEILPGVIREAIYNGELVITRH